MVQYRNFASEMGRLTATPELRTAGESKVLNFTVAVNRVPRQDSDHPEADFIDCVAWGKTAENIAKFFKRGDRIGVIGSLQTRNYEDKNGVKKKVTEILVDSFEFIEKKSDEAEAKAAAQPDDNDEEPY